MKQSKIRRCLPDLYMILIYTFFFLPVLVVIEGSFNTNIRNTSFDGFTLRWYGQLMENTGLLESLQNTLVLAVISMLLATFIGTIAAFGMFRYKFRGKTIIDTMFYVPIVIPEIVLGISLMTIFSISNIEGGLTTLCIAHTTFCVPYVVFNVRASIAGFDPALEEASMDLGVAKLKTFIKITLPLILPGILSGAFMAFTLSIDDVIISYFTNGPAYVTLPIKVMGMTKRGITPDVNALATLIMIVVVVIAVLSQLNYKKIFRKRGKR